tara:strand:- start:963 stop:1643 length:681 start_codon:yes stop_codon:yes gene_type:complete
MKNAIILCSGGLDSVVAAYYVKDKYKKLKFLFFDYGQKALENEEKCCREISKRLNAEFVKVELPWLHEISTSMINREGFKETTEKDLETDKGIENWYVPCRNSIFLINGLAFAESEFLKNKEKYDIVIGFENEGEAHFKDTTEGFVKKINELSTETTEGYEILAPLIKKDKTEVIKLGKELKVPFELTYSCYIGGEGHCGKCLNCMLRKKGFYWAGVEDVSSYKSK